MKVVWTTPASTALEQIRSYIASDSEAYANAFVLKLLKSVGRLEQFPRLGREVPERDDSDIRELIVAPYRVIYLLQADQVFVLTIVHGSRDFAQQVHPWE